METEERLFEDLFPDFRGGRVPSVSAIHHGIEGNRPPGPFVSPEFFASSFNGPFQKTDGVRKGPFGKLHSDPAHCYRQKKTRPKNKLKKCS
jgi:hypothetical protein